MNTKGKCSVQVSGQGQWGDFHPHQCHKNAVAERDGKLYCRVHDPEEVKKRSTVATAKWNAKIDRLLLEAEAATACEQVNPDNPMAVAKTIVQAFEALRYADLHLKSEDGTTPLTGIQLVIKAALGAIEAKETK